MALRALALFALAAAATLAAAAASLNHPSGTHGLLLVDKVGGRVRFLDPTTFAERGSLELPKNPHDFALSADHRFAFVPIYGPGVYGRNPTPEHEIYVLDLERRKVDKVIPRRAESSTRSRTRARAIGSRCCPMAARRTSRTRTTRRSSACST